jgi:hypothetical protein
MAVKSLEGGGEKVKIKAHSKLVLFNVFIGFEACIKLCKSRLNRRKILDNPSNPDIIISLLADYGSKPLLLLML